MELKSTLAAQQYAATPSGNGPEAGGRGRTVEPVCSAVSNRPCARPRRRRRPR